MTNDQINSTLYVSKETINEAGVLSTCKILDEITRINDDAIVRAFGNFNLSCISVAHYHIDILRSAQLGDTLKIESQYTVLQNGMLQVKIAMNKSIKRKPVPVLSGNFTFISSL
ncbi:MAG: hypothetical protein K9G49_09820 [Taibaiella sp.]|nr:hypothetical protein [Taibaiella sp.]